MEKFVELHDGVASLIACGLVYACEYTCEERALAQAYSILEMYNEAFNQRWGSVYPADTREHP